MTEDEAGMRARPARDVIREVDLRLTAAGAAAERERHQFDNLSAPEMDRLVQRERRA